MKKARIMLSAIAVLAILGGTVAFKAYSRTHVLFTGTAEGAPCDVQIRATIALTGVTVYYSLVEGAPCVVGFTTSSL